MRIGWGAAITLAAGLASVAAGAAVVSSPKNDFNAAIEKMAPADRAAYFAQTVGLNCIGTQTFLMGVADSGAEEGNAYWSVACLDGTSFAIQIDPLGRQVAVPCSVLADTGKGKECFKKF
jgi:hypothetical protein